MKYFLTINKLSDDYNVNWARGLFYYNGKTDKKIYTEEERNNLEEYKNNPEEFIPCDNNNLKHITCFCLSKNTEKEIIDHIRHILAADFKAGLIMEEDIPKFNPDNELKIIRPIYKKKSEKMEESSQEDEILTDLRYIVMKMVKINSSLKGMRNAEYIINENSVTVRVNNDVNVRKWEKNKDYILSEMINSGHPGLELNIECHVNYETLSYGVPLKKDLVFFNMVDLLWCITTLKYNQGFLLSLINKFGKPKGKKNKKIIFDEQKENVDFLRDTIETLGNDKYLENKTDNTLDDLVDVKTIDKYKLESVLEDFMIKAVCVWDDNQKKHRAVFRKFYDLAMFVKHYIEKLREKNLLSEFPEVENFSDIAKKKLIPGQARLTDK